MAEGVGCGKVVAIVACQRPPAFGRPPFGGELQAGGKEMFFELWPRAVCIDCGAHSIIESRKWR